MKAAWDWALPRETVREERELVNFAADLGFDTLIVRRPTDEMVDVGHERGLSVLQILNGRPPSTFTDEHPTCLQEIHPVEEGILAAIADGPDGYHQLAHRWFPPVLGGDFYCFEQEESLRSVEGRIEAALDVADGIAFDGFGFRNHYACFCEACEGRRERLDMPRLEAIEKVGRDQLISTSERLYDHAKSVAPDAVITNHVWPPFRPDPTYGRDLRLDYCTQTIAWFYRPNWSKDRVRDEAERHARLAGEANTFVPFIGMHDEEGVRRSPGQLQIELEIALEYGDGHVTLCTLGAPHASPDHAAVVSDVLSTEAAG